MNRRRHANIVPVAALVRWVVVAFFLCTAGLGYVYFKNQMQTTGNEIRNLEAQLKRVAARRTTPSARRSTGSPRTATSSGDWPRVSSN